MKKIISAMLCLILAFSFMIQGNAYDAYAFEQNWVYGNYTGANELGYYSLSIEPETETGGEYISFDVYTKFNEHIQYKILAEWDGIKYHGYDINAYDACNYDFYYNGNDSITLISQDGYYVNFTKVSDMSHNVG